MKTVIGSIISIIGLVILIHGLYSYFHLRNKQWIKTEAKIIKADIISKTLNDDKAETKKYRLIKKYTYTIDKTIYNGDFMSDWTSESLTEKVKNIKPQSLFSIYYDKDQPHISKTDMPVMGVDRIIIGSILIAFGSYVILNRCPKPSLKNFRAPLPLR